MWKKEFDTSYVGFMKDGAQWLVDNTDIKLVGEFQLALHPFTRSFIVSIDTNVLLSSVCNYVKFVHLITVWVCMCQWSEL
uniref:Uncharacterized protein n=1 Tax=Aegilops tauschii subsp. strangulata TaxID=200361 RepID=A0A453L1Y6_AEGTS